jgi:hypothetical protein
MTSASNFTNKVGADAGCGERDLVNPEEVSYELMVFSGLIRYS